jgi:hypothetical protein
MSNGDQCKKHDNFHAHCQQCCAEDLSEAHAENEHNKDLVYDLALAHNALIDIRRWIDFRALKLNAYWEEADARYKAAAGPEEIARCYTARASASDRLHDFVNANLNTLGYVYRVVGTK